MQWAEGKSLDLNGIIENTRRAGIAWQSYPSAYAGRGLKPDLYFAPIAADHAVKMAKKPKDYAPPDTAAK